MEYIGKEFYDRHDKPQLVHINNEKCIPLNQRNLFYNDSFDLVCRNTEK